MFHSILSTPGGKGRSKEAMGEKIVMKTKKTTMWLSPLGSWLRLTCSLDLVARGAPDRPIPLSGGSGSRGLSAPTCFSPPEAWWFPSPPDSAEKQGLWEHGDHST